RGSCWRGRRSLAVAFWFLRGGRRLVRGFEECRLVKTRERRLNVFDRERLVGGKQQRLQHFFQVERHASKDERVNAPRSGPRNPEVVPSCNGKRRAVLSLPLANALARFPR